MTAPQHWITGGTVITGRGAIPADVGIANGKIVAVAERCGPAVDELADQSPDQQPERRASDDDFQADGLWVLPGGVDAHVHFGMPLAGGISSLGWRESSEAALLGGTTTVIDFANPDRGEPIGRAVERWLRMATSQCHCDFGLHATVTETSGGRLAELPQLVRQGIPTFKGFLAYKDRLMLTVAEMETLMRSVAGAGGRLLVHAEDGEMNAAAEAVLVNTGRIGPEWHPKAHPEESEVKAVAQCLDLALRTRCPLTLVHLSLAESLHRLIRARRRLAEQVGAAADRLTGEVCLHHLFGGTGCCDGSYEASLRVVMSPPIRSVQDSKALLAGLAAGELDILSTDHCEFQLAVKTAAARGGFPKIPSGIGGVGERLVFAYAKGVVTGDLTPERWIRVCCERPAELMGLAGRKGRIAEGYDADILIFDPKTEYKWTPLGASDPAGSLWAGTPVQGAVRDVFLRGQRVVRHGRLESHIPNGKFLERSY